MNIFAEDISPWFPAASAFNCSLVRKGMTVLAWSTFHEASRIKLDVPPLPMALLRRLGQLWITTERSDRAGHYCLPNPTWEQENWNAKYFSKILRGERISRSDRTLPVGSQRRDNELIQKYRPIVWKNNRMKKLITLTFQNSNLKNLPGKYYM